MNIHTLGLQVREYNVGILSWDTATWAVVALRALFCTNLRDVGNSVFFSKDLSYFSPSCSFSPQKRQENNLFLILTPLVPHRYFLMLYLLDCLLFKVRDHVLYIYFVLNV